MLTTRDELLGRREGGGRREEGGGGGGEEGEKREDENKEDEENMHLMILKKIWIVLPQTINAQHLFLLIHGSRYCVLKAHVLQSVSDDVQW